MYKNEARPGGAPSGAGVLATIAVAQFMVSLDVSVVNVALPTIRKALGFDQVGLPWVVNAYALAFGGLLLLGGRAVDRFGRRPILFIALALFAGTSLLGGLAQTPGELIAARAAQGVAGAMLAPAALAILNTTFPGGRERGRALGVYSAVTAGGAAIGVVTGGLLTEYVDWRWVMFLNVPMAVIGIFLALRFVTVSGAGDQARRLDFVGAVFATSGVALLVLGLVRTNTEAWSSPATIGTLSAAVVLLILFGVYESRFAGEPLLRLGLLRSRVIAGANLYMMILGITMFTGFYFVSLYLQQVLQFKAAPAGLAFLPFCAGLICGSIFAVPLIRIFGARRILVVCGLVGGLGLIWFSRVRAGGDFAGDVLGPSLVTSFGIGPCLVPVAGMATAGVPRQEAGMAAGLVNTSRQVGGSLGLAAMSTIAATRTAHESLAESPAARLTAGYGTSFLVDGGLLIFAALLALLVFPSDQHRPAPTGAATRPEQAGATVGRPAGEQQPVASAELGPRRPGDAAGAEPA